MIGQLRGIIAEKEAPDLLIDVQGVGYELQAPLTTFYKLPSIGEAATLYTHLSVREDAQQLFGFVDRHERSLFRALIRVSGVGPKLALAILSGMEVGDFVRCVQLDDTSSLVKVPGVGKKTAERLLIELRDRLGDWGPVTGAVEVSHASGTPAAEIEDAENALIALGYKPQEASRAIAAVDANENTSSEELIRLALRAMMPAAGARGRT